VAGDQPLPDSVPVLEETLRVEKTARESDRLWIKTSVAERTEYVDLELLTGEAVIERVQVNRIVDTAPAIREEGDIIIVPLLEEIIVVEKKLVLREEIHIRRHETVKHVREPIRLRSEQVSLERPPLTNPNTEDKP
jgi:uncharacterized protein (TIGR02271 family)